MYSINGQISNIPREIFAIMPAAAATFAGLMLYSQTYAPAKTFINNSDLGNDIYDGTDSIGSTFKSTMNDF